MEPLQAYRSRRCIIIPLISVAYVTFSALVQLLTFTHAGRFHNPVYANTDDFSTLFGPSTNPTLHLPDTAIPSIFISFGVVSQSNIVKCRSLPNNAYKGYRDIQIHHVSQLHERHIAFITRSFGEDELTFYTPEGAIPYTSMYGSIRKYFLLVLANIS